MMASCKGERQKRRSREGGRERDKKTKEKEGEREAKTREERETVLRLKHHQLNWCLL